LALLLWREVVRYARLLPMLIITGVLYVATSSVDTFVESATAASTVIEEGINVCCSTFFMLSMLTGLVAARWMRGPRVDDETRAVPGSVDHAPQGRWGAATTVWAGVIALMTVIGLLVALIDKGGYRILLVWAVVPVLAAVVIGTTLKLDRRR
jgi:hypothetical protein